MTIYEYKYRLIWTEIQLEILLLPPLSSGARLSWCLECRHNRVREAGLFRLCPVGQGEVIVRHWVLHSLRAMIRNKKVVTRDLYQVPCQFKTSEKWLVRTKFCQFKLYQRSSVMPVVWACTVFVSELLLSKQLSRLKPLRTKNSSFEISIDGKLPPELLLLAECFT